MQTNFITPYQYRGIADYQLHLVAAPLCPLVIVCQRTLPYLIEIPQQWHRNRSLVALLSLTLATPIAALSSSSPPALIQIPIAPRQIKRRTTVPAVSSFKVYSTPAR
jgi:hypothetical protein